MTTISAPGVGNVPVTAGSGPIGHTWIILFGATPVDTGNINSYGQHGWMVGGDAGTGFVAVTVPANATVRSPYIVGASNYAQTTSYSGSFAVGTAPPAPPTGPQCSPC